LFFKTEQITRVISSILVTNKLKNQVKLSDSPL